MVGWAAEFHPESGSAWDWVAFGGCQVGFSKIEHRHLNPNTPCMVYIPGPSGLGVSIDSP